MIVHTYSSSPQIIYTLDYEFDATYDMYDHARMRLNAFENSIARAVMRGPNISPQGLLWALAWTDQANQIEKDLDDADLFTI